MPAVYLHGIPRKDRPEKEAKEDWTVVADREVLADGIPEVKFEFLTAVLSDLCTWEEQARFENGLVHWMKMIR